MAFCTRHIVGFQIYNLFARYNYKQADDTWAVAKPIGPLGSGPPRSAPSATRRDRGRYLDDSDVQFWLREDDVMKSQTKHQGNTRKGVF